MKQSKHLPENCVDIILVTYQRVHFLKKTIASIKERTLYPHRLIVVNNASTDGTKEYLARMNKTGVVDEVVNLEENVGQAESQNIGLELVKTNYFVTTQDDLLPPELKPCWLERLVHLMEKHEDYGSICLRIERTRRVDWEETEDIIRNYKSMPSVFRMHRTEEILSMGPKPFGNRKHWESPECAKMMKTLKKKFGFATHIYSSHIGFMAENKGYIGGFDKYFTYSKERVKQGEDKPYPTIDFRTHVPLEINHPVDTSEHQKRLDYWGMDTGVQSDGETKRKWKQRYELGQYCATHGGKWVDMGCGSEKCHEDEIGIDTYPLSKADILHTTEDLWFFKDEELDGITSCHHLEHVTDPKSVLKEWDRVLKRGGIMATIVPDGLFRPSTIREESHKSAFTMEVIKQMFGRVLGHKILRLEHVENIAERKKSIICVSRKR